VNPAVLRWALEQDGLSAANLAAGADVSREIVNEWLSGDSKPSRGEFSRIVEVLKRPRALFLLPAPPAAPVSQTNLRSAPGLLDRDDLSTQEIRGVRQATRLQRLAASLLAESSEDAHVDVPEIGPDVPSEQVAATLRSWLGIPVAQQKLWRDEGEALKAWRDRLDHSGIIVVQMSLGKPGESIRGFSVWDAFAPLIAVNTGYNNAARIFTLFHELAHLASRTDSACTTFVGPSRRLSGRRSVERWCEEVSSALLLPKAEMQQFAIGDGVDMDTVRRVGRRFKVSMRAVALRFIRLQLAPSALYGQVEAHFAFLDRSEGGGGGKGIVAAERRIIQYGNRLPELILRAEQADRISLRDAVDYLRVTTSQYDELSARFVSQGR
jgi:Zn-dependent peptidase ImmA (M78 family)/transcriptional regulator with XRE-family HTH domain